MTRDFSYELLNFFRTVEVVEQREEHVLRVNALTSRFADIGVLHDCFLLGPEIIGAHRSYRKRKTSMTFRSAIYAPWGFGIGAITTRTRTDAIAKPWEVIPINPRNKFVAFSQWPSIVKLSLLERLIKHLRQFQTQIIQTQNLT
jgi:hypothetical protein